MHGHSAPLVHEAQGGEPLSLVALIEDVELVPAPLGPRWGTF